MIFALIGNQNCGKTTLFNSLTGSNQHVGNFPGVTVEQKIGQLKNHKNSQIVDLPGIYSLSPFSSEEILTRDFIIKEKPDCIINIIDATNIERNLYLTLQLTELATPMVIALNMIDEVLKSGNSIDTKKLSEGLGIPVVPISAIKGSGINELIDTVMSISKKKELPQKIDFCSGALHRAIHSVAHTVEDHAAQLGIPSRFASTKLIEGDKVILKELDLSKNEKDLLEHVIIELENELSCKRDVAIADMRYNFIENICENTVKKINKSTEYIRSEKIDNILTNKYLALPIFFGIMFLIFYLTFGVIGTFLSDLLSVGIDYITELCNIGLNTLEINPLVISLVIDGIFAGVGSVLSFLPIIIILFFFLSILEDSGYMARVAFIMDTLLRKIGLSGRSFVPMLIGFGCSVPAIMSTRTLSSERDRKMTIILTPFMSCSAKLPIYAVFTAAFFPSHSALAMIALYIIGIIIAILLGLILKESLFKGNPVPFVMELPPYRIPSAKNVLLLMWERAKDFLVKAFTVIFIATIIIWFLQTLDFRLNLVANSSDSILASIGKLIAPIFIPLGFNDWKIPTALITGFTAKEAVISTLAVLMNTGIENLENMLSTIFTPLSAFAFLVFTLLYTPCIAAVSVIKKELKSTTSTIAIIAAQTLLAYGISFLIYRIGLFVI